LGNGLIVAQHSSGPMTTQSHCHNLRCIVGQQEDVARPTRLSLPNLQRPDSIPNDITTTRFEMSGNKKTLPTYLALILE